MQGYSSNDSQLSAAAINPLAAENPSNTAAQPGAAPMPPTGGDLNGTSSPPGPDWPDLHSHRAYCPPPSTDYGTHRLTDMDKQVGFISPTASAGSLNPVSRAPSGPQESPFNKKS